MTEVSHETLKKLTARLNPRQTEDYFVWRRAHWVAMRFDRLPRPSNYNDPGFVALCLQKLLTYELDMQRRANAFAYTPTQNDS